MTYLTDDPQIRLFVPSTIASPPLLVKTTNRNNLFSWQDKPRSVVQEFCYGSFTYYDEFPNIFQLLYHTVPSAI